MISKFTTTMLGLLLALCTFSSVAAPIHVTGQFKVDKSFEQSADFFPLGTLVTVDLKFDIDGLTDLGSQAPVSGFTGSLSWNNGAAQSFSLDRGRIYQLGSSSGGGSMGFEFKGAGPTQGEYTLTTIYLIFGLPVSPFIKGNDFAELLARSDKGLVQMLAEKANRSGFGTRLTQDWVALDVAGPNETDVPEPVSAALIGVGLAGIAAMRRRRA